MVTDGEISITLTTPENVSFLTPNRSRRNSGSDGQIDFKDLVVKNNYLKIN